MNLPRLKHNKQGRIKCAQDLPVLEEEDEHTQRRLQTEVSTHSLPDAQDLSRSGVHQVTLTPKLHQHKSSTMFVSRKKKLPSLKAHKKSR